MNYAASALLDGSWPLLVSSSPSEFWRSQYSSRLKLQNIGFARWKTCVQSSKSAGSWVNYAFRSDTWRGEMSNAEQDVPRRMTVGVFWDLDNKPPALVPPYDAAIRLRSLASELGEVVEMVAYANKNAFTYIPSWVREQRQERKLLDQLEVRGLVQLERPYFCKLCHRMCKTNIALKGHFKQVHERERKKRLGFLKTLRGKRRAKFLSKIAEQEVRYKKAVRGVITPKSGYGLGSELRRAGVDVKMVESKPQAADEALEKHMTLCVSKGLECICLVSDDSDFLGVLKAAKSKGLKIVVVGDAYTLQRAADRSFSWKDVAAGRHLHEATMRRWLDAHAPREVAFRKNYDFGESDFMESVEGACRASCEDQDRETYDEDLENADYIQNEVEVYFSESDDEGDYLASLRWTLRS